MKISESHDPCGHILQLIAISTDPDAALGLGSELRAFALLLAKLDPTLHSVIGVTRCSDFVGDDIAKYVAAHEIGAQTDKTLAFHTGYGAQILRLVHEFRPEDVKNRGTGVLIQCLGESKKGHVFATSSLFLASCRGVLSVLRRLAYNTRSTFF